MSDGLAKDALEKFLKDGFIGCVRVEDFDNMDKNIDIKVIILERFDSVNNIFCGFIPNDQIRFYDIMKDAIKEVVQRNNIKLNELYIQQKETLKTIMDGEDAVVAMEWLEKNRNKFKGRVYDPMLMCITINDALTNARFLEATIPSQDLVAFATENAEDTDALNKQLRDLKGNSNLYLNVKVIQLHSQVHLNFQPDTKLSDEKKTKFGFKGYLKDMFKCPKAIKGYLCETYNLHNVPVFSSDALPYKNALSETYDLFFIGNTRNRVYRYDYKTKVYTDRVFQKKWL